MSDQLSSPYGPAPVAHEDFVFSDEELLGPRDPREAPQRRTNPARAIGRFFGRYARFSGRSSRSEYWWVGLLNVVVIYGAGIVAIVLADAAERSGAAGPGIAAGLLGALIAVFLLGSFIPGLALGVRRLHDANLSGWFLLLGAVPGIGPMALLVFSLLPHSPAGERFDRRTGAVV